MRFALLAGLTTALFCTTTVHTAELDLTDKPVEKVSQHLGSAQFVPDDASVYFSLRKPWPLMQNQRNSRATFMQLPGPQMGMLQLRQQLGDDWKAGLDPLVSSARWRRPSAISRGPCQL